MTKHFYGTTLKIGANTIEEIVSISGPTLSVDMTETSNLGSTEQWKTYFPTWKDGGEITVKANYDMTNTYQDSVLDTVVLATQVSTAFTLTYPDTSAFAFSGTVTKFTPSGEVGADKMELEFTIKITGKVTYTAPA